MIKKILLIAVLFIASIKFVAAEQNDKPILLVAKIFVKPSQIDEFKKITKKIIKETRKEKGCLRYDLHQLVEDSTVFVFVEEFTNKAAQEFHSAQPYFKEFKEKSATLLAKPNEAAIYEIKKIN